MGANLKLAVLELECERVPLKEPEVDSDTVLLSDAVKLVDVLHLAVLERLALREEVSEKLMLSVSVDEGFTSGLQL